jgi:ribonuclease Z
MADKVKLTFLGTSGAIPTSKRNHSSFLISYKKENILVDCGEGTQRQLRKLGISPMKVTRLLITHWHGDHVLGIPGLLQTLAFNDYNKTLFIYGPKGTKKFMKLMLNTFVFSGKISIEVEEIRKKKFIDNEDLSVFSERMIHGTFCNAYSFLFKGKIRIDKSKLKKYKIPEGAHLSGLKKGKNIVYKNKKFKVKELTFREDDKKISFVLDTLFNSRILPFVKSESNFCSEIEEQAKIKKHLTAKQAGEIAKKAKVKKLFLTHLSQRYSKEPQKVLGEAKSIFKNTFLAKDLDIVEI